MFPVKARAWSLLAILMILSSAIMGQTSSGEVNGSVSDQTGAAISSATVKLINQGTRIETQATLNKDGRFTFVNVKPGIYVLRVEAQGFKSAQTQSFNVAVSQTVTQDVGLSIGDVSQTVEVSGVSELVQRSSVELGAVISEREVQDLPLNGRNFTQLLTLTPGVTPVSTSQNRNVGGVEGNVGIPGSGFSDPSFHGQQNRSKLYFYDGIINTNIRGPTYIVIPNIDAVQEFKVVGHDAKAEFGGATGGVMNMVSKSGGNNIHGSAFEYRSQRRVRRAQQLRRLHIGEMQTGPGRARQSIAVPSEPVWRGRQRADHQEPNFLLRQLRRHGVTVRPALGCPTCRLPPK